MLQKLTLHKANFTNNIDTQLKLCHNITKTNYLYQHDDNGIVRDKSSLLVDDESSDSFITDSSDIKTSFSKNLKKIIYLEFEDTQLMILRMYVNPDKRK